MPQIKITYFDFHGGRAEPAAELDEQQHGGNHPGGALAHRERRDVSFAGGYAGGCAEEAQSHDEIVALNEVACERPIGRSLFEDFAVPGFPV